MANIFFDGWESIFRTVIITVLAYIALVFFTADLPEKDVIENECI